MNDNSTLTPPRPSRETTHPPGGGGTESTASCARRQAKRREQEPAQLGASKVLSSARSKRVEGPMVEQMAAVFHSLPLQPVGRFFSMTS